MSQKIPITVLINTLNAGEHLDELFDSILPHVEDVFITDSRSIDDTVDMCLKRGVKIVQRPFKNCGEQAQWSMDNLPIKTDWIFIMAQDERFSESLVTELKQIFTDGIPDDVDGYVYFKTDKNISFGEFVKVKITKSFVYDLEGELVD